MDRRDDMPTFELGAGIVIAILLILGSLGFVYWLGGEVGKL